MIARDAVPIAHTPPLRRVDLNARPPRNEPVDIDLDCISKFAEQERIWQLVRETASGTNPP